MVELTVVVTNAAGTMKSNPATLTLTASPMPPQITTQPAKTVSIGQAATFSVTASGTAPLKYQWQEDAKAIVGATESSYTTPPALGGDNGSSFSVVVTTAAGSMTSHAATLP